MIFSLLRKLRPTSQPDIHLDAFIEEFGRPTQRRRALGKVIDKYAGKLPPRLLAYWKDLGFSGFADGLIWITNPDDYVGALQEWIGDTPIVDEDTYHVIARTGFGHLYLWGEKNGHKYTIDPLDGWIRQHGEGESQIDDGDADKALGIFFATRHIDRCDQEGATDTSSDEPLFAHAVAKFGPLAADEVFGFAPSPMLGGSTSLNCIIKCNVHVHLSILAQMGDREIVSLQSLIRKAFG